jgi:hypothetical protein
VVVALLLAGCETTPTGGARFEIDPARVYSVDLLAREPRDMSKVLVTLSRDPGLMIGACNFDVYAHDLRLAKVAPGETVRFELPAGRYRFHAEYGGIICPPYSTPGIHLDAAPGDAITLRMGARDMIGFMRLEPRTRSPGTAPDLKAAPSGDR